MKVKRGKGHVPGAPRPFFRWTFRWAGPGLRRAVFGLLGGLALAPSLAYAQAPVTQALPAKSYMNKSTAILPIQIDPRMRSALREVQLYLKTPGLKEWVRHDVAPPDQKEFVFRAPRDGEYWFTVVTVDKSGRFNPADLRNVVPGVIVVVDTQPPEPDLRCLPDTADGHCVQCVVRDANPDSSKTRFEYQSGDQKWRMLESTPNQSDVFCIPQQAVVTGLVRVTTADRCGNTVTREINLSSCGGLASAGTSASSGVEKSHPSAGKALQQPSRLEVGSVVTARSVTSSASTGCHTSCNSPAPGLLPRVVADPVEAAVPPGAVVPGQETKEIQKVVYAPEGPALGGVVPSLRKVVNSSRVFLDYKIEQTGPSGVGHVEIYMTKNQGQSWERLGEDEDHQSPAVIDLPCDGIFGVKLVVSNGRGFGATPPAVGDTPDWWIEVDTTKPVAELLSVQAGQGNDLGVMVINWSARDKNLSSEPIDLLYAQNPEGPWQVVIRGLKNEPPYRWTVPNEVGSQAYIRLLVKDQSGNVTECETPQAVLLDDRSRPRIRVTNVSTTGPATSTASAPALP